MAIMVEAIERKYLDRAWVARVTRQLTRQRNVAEARARETLRKEVEFEQVLTDFDAWPALPQVSAAFKTVGGLPYLRLRGPDLTGLTIFGLLITFAAYGWRIALAWIATAALVSWLINQLVVVRDARLMEGARRVWLNLEPQPPLSILRHLESDRWLSRT